jgi:hypothetical protein
MSETGWNRWTGLLAVAAVLGRVASRKKPNSVSGMTDI